VKLFLKRNKAARIALKGDDTYGGGDFRSAECLAFLKEADIVVTNPPFSLFKEYVAQLVEHGKEIPRHRQHEFDYLQGDFSAHQGQQNMARLHKL
jgi:hypothetical protein